MLTDKKSKDT